MSANKITDLEHAALGIVANALPILRDAEKHSAWSVEAEQVVEAMDRWTNDYHVKMDAAPADPELDRLRAVEQAALAYMDAPMNPLRVEALVHALRPGVRR